MQSGGRNLRNPSDLTPGLYLVATPVGNLEDITLRALRILKEADLIACEDTRQTQKLLNHFAISTRTISYHQHNEAARAEELGRELERGARIAVVTDAGTPGVSDPGFRLLAWAIQHGIAVVPIPGASAFLLALAGSGLPTDAFAFHGFFPVKRGPRRQALETIRTSSGTQVYYEAPHRIIETVEDIVEILGAGRNVVVARELTKLHEEFLRGRAGEVLENLNAREQVKGEITLLIAQAEERSGPSEGTVRLTVRQRLVKIVEEEKLDEKAALKKVAKELKISKSQAYRELQRSKQS